MNRGFTLIELMTVVGIMAFLGVAATGGYNALQRGMAERSAVEVATRALVAAKERAIVDRVPTAVYCYNRLVREADANNNAIVVGELVAVRRSGRVSKKNGMWLYDEFGDLDRSYTTFESEDGVKDSKGIRLWWFGDTETSMSSMKYSIVADGVLVDDGGVLCYTYTPWTDSTDSKGSNITCRALAFYDLGESRHQPTWAVGNGYGFEFMRVQLPNNFIFGSGIPSQMGDTVSEKSFYFDPENPKDGQVDVYSCRSGSGGVPVPSGQKAGTARSDGGGA